MGWDTPIVGYHHPRGRLYCVEHSGPARGVPVHADTSPTDKCDRCGKALGGDRSARSTVYVDELGRRHANGRPV